MRGLHEYEQMYYKDRTEATQEQELQKSREESSNSAVEQLEIQNNGERNGSKLTTAKNTDRYTRKLTYAATVNNATVASIDIFVHRQDDRENERMQIGKEVAIPTAKENGKQREAAQSRDLLTLKTQLRRKLKKLQT